MPVKTAAAATYTLTLAGTDCGDVKSVSGGGISAPVVEEKTADGFTAKRIGPPTYEEIAVQIGLAATPDVYAWISSAWTPSPGRRDGSVVTLDGERNAISERRFEQALITAVTVPALDGSSTDAGFLTLKFRPAHISTQAGGGKATTLSKPAKRWLASNFRLDLDGIDTSRVVRVESFTITHDVAGDALGVSREPALEPAALEFPDLLVTIQEQAAQTWEAWFQDFVVDGNNGATQAKSGALVFHAPDMKTELGRIVLHNVGICALRPAPLESGGQHVARVVAELYCDRMELQVGTPPPAPTPVLPKPPVVPIRPTPVVPRT